MTVHRPGSKVREWIEQGVLWPTDPDEHLEWVMTRCGYHDASWRHEALTALRIIRYEDETGEPF